MNRKVLVDTDVERIIRRLSVEPVQSVHLNSNSEIIVKFKNRRIVKQKLDTYFRIFLSILDNVKRLEKIMDNEQENEEDRRSFVPDTNQRYYVFGFRRGDRFKSVSQSGVEFFTRLS